MKIKKLSVGIAGMFLFVAAGLPQTALADKTVKMDMRFAGAFATGILHVNPMTGDIVPSALVHTNAVGSPGRAEVRGYGAGGDAFPVETDECLGSSGIFLSIVVGEDPLIFAFQDLSLLFAKGGSGEICIDLTTGNSVFEFNITFMGGRGRFEGATGQAVIRGESEPVSADGSFQGETGTIVGWINLP